MEYLRPKQEKEGKPKKAEHSVLHFVADRMEQWASFPQSSSRCHPDERLFGEDLFERLLDPHFEGSFLH
jgi:hypothetical protein